MTNQKPTVSRKSARLKLLAFFVLSMIVLGTGVTLCLLNTIDDQFLLGIVLIILGLGGLVIIALAADDKFWRFGLN